VDDGSSVMAEICDTTALSGVDESIKLSLTPEPVRFANGATVRVKATLLYDWKKVSLVLAREDDIGQSRRESAGVKRASQPIKLTRFFHPPLVEVSAEEETRHIKAVCRLHLEVYPNFDRNAYLASDLLPPPRPVKRIVQPPTATTSRSIVKKEDMTNISGSSGLSLESQPSGSFASVSLSSADMSYMSTLSGTPVDLPDGVSIISFRFVADPCVCSS
jgi:hypothetical protein